MRERPELTYGAVAVIFLLLVWWGPTPAFRMPGWLIVIAVLFGVGTEALRRQTAREFPDAKLARLRHARLIAGSAGRTANVSISSSTEPSGRASCIARTRPSSVGRSCR